MAPKFLEKTQGQVRTRGMLLIVWEPYLLQVSLHPVTHQHAQLAFPIFELTLPILGLG